MPKSTILSYRKPPVIETGRAKINVLAVTPIDTDYARLQEILTPNKWVLFRARDLRSAQLQLRTSREPFALVLCECNLCPGTWRELLDQLAGMDEAPFLIVVSRFADERLWAEVLNLGAFDVLAKPFEAGEVTRVLASAWMRWTRQYSVATQSQQPVGAVVGA